MNERKWSELKKNDIDKLQNKIAILFPFLVPAFYLINNSNDFLKLLESITKYLN